MPMTPIQRKAAFKEQVELNQTTCEEAAKNAIGVTWHHLREGLMEKPERPLSEDVKTKFAAYIGRPFAEVFPAKRQLKETATG